MAKFLNAFLIMLILVDVAEIAHSSTIVDIDARLNSELNPISLLFTAGTYEATPIGVADGGIFNAWDPFGPGQRWWCLFYIETDEFRIAKNGGDVFYATDLLALENAESAVFTLTSDCYVDIFVADSYYDDNIGGVSLEITSVPLPSAIWLLCSGLIGLVGFRRKFKKI